MSWARSAWLKRGTPFVPAMFGLRNEPAQAPPADLGASQQDEMGTATAFADPAQVLLDRLAVARQPGALGARPDREALGHVARGDAWPRTRAVHVRPVAGAG